jgi:hypothetical protein
VELWPSAGGLQIQQPQGIPRRVVLALDTSSSMGRGPGSGFEKVREVSRSFVQVATSKDCHIGVVCFREAAMVGCPLSGDPGVVAAAIDRLEAGGGTRLEAGLDAAHGVLRQGQEGGGVERVVILLTDGGGAASPALAAANRLKEDGIRLVTVGLGHSVDHRLLAALASSPKDHRSALTPEDLGYLYQASVGGAGLRGELVEGVNRSAFAYQGPGSLAPSRVDLSAGRLEWFLPEVAGVTGSVEYRVRALRPGWHPLAAFPARVILEDEAGGSFEATSELSPRLLVLPRFPGRLAAPILNPLFYLLAGRFQEEAEPFQLQRREAREPLPSARPRSLPPASQPSPPPLEPALVLGVGHTGRQVLEAFRAQLEELPENGAETVRTLWLDTGVSEAGEGQHLTERVLMSEGLETRIREEAAHGRSGGGLQDFQWMDAERALAGARSTDFDLTYGTRAQRHLGRAALRHHLSASTAPELTIVLGRLAQELRLGYRVLVVAGMGGGTGGGALVDLLVHLRGTLDTEGRPPRSTDLLLLPPEALRESEGLRPLEEHNTVAFAVELSRILAGGSAPRPMVPAGCGPAVRRILDSVLVLQQPLETPAAASATEAVACSAAGMCWQILASPDAGLARYLEQQRPELRRAMRERGQALVLTAGLTWRRLPLPKIREWLLSRVLLEQLKVLRGQAGEGSHRADALELLSGEGWRRPAPWGLARLEELADDASASKALSELLGPLNTLPGSTVSPEGVPAPLLGEILNAQQEALDARIQEWALRLLNNCLEPEAQGGGIVSLREALQQLVEWSEAALAQMDALEGGASQRGWRGAHRFARHLVGRYRQSFASARRQADLWSHSLTPDPAATAGADPSLGGLLVDRFRRLESELQEEARCLAPFTLWSEELSSYLWRQYGERVLSKSVDYLAWVAQDPGGWNLRVADEEPAKGPWDLAALEEGLRTAALSLGVGAVATEPVTDHLNLGAWLDSHHRRDPVPLNDLSQAEQAGQAAQRREFLLQSEGGSAAQERGEIETVNAGPPHWISIARVLSPCALRAISAVAAPGLERILHADLPWVEPEDRRAAVAEDRLARLGRTPRFLCPPVRAGFASPERLYAFALAAALGLLNLRSRDEAVVFGNQIFHSDEGRTAQPLLTALESFLQGSGPPLRELEGAVELEIEERSLEELGRLGRQGGEVTEALGRLGEGSPEVVVQDLAAIALLALDEAVDKRRQGGSS